MVERIIVNPESVRGLGNIVDHHSVDDYVLSNSELEVSTDLVDGVETSVFVMSEYSSNISIALVLSSSTVTVGGSVTLTATVLDDETPLSGVTVSFKSGTTLIGEATTGSGGVANYTYVTSTVGSLNLVASYGGVNSASASLTVNKHTTTLSLVVDQSSVIVGQNILMTATLLDENNDPVINEYLDLYYKIGGSTGYIAPARTNQEGVVTYSYHTNRTDVTALYVHHSATDLYDASNSADVSITVLPHSYSVAFSQSSYVASDGSATLSLTLLDNNVPKSGASVSVTGSDSSSYSCTTDSSGVGSVTVTGISAETTFTATYSSVSDTYTVTTSNVIYQPALDGTEAITNINAYHPSISDNELVKGCGYLTAGWDNTVDWELTFEYYVTGDNNGYLVIPQGTTQRDKQGIQQWYCNQLNFRINGSSPTGNITSATSCNQWISVKIKKLGYYWTVYYNNTLKTSWNTTPYAATVDNWETMCIGLDCDNSSNTAKIRNIVVKKLD